MSGDKDELEEYIEFINNKNKWLNKVVPILQKDIKENGFTVKISGNELYKIDKERIDKILKDSFIGKPYKISASIRPKFNRLYLFLSYIINDNSESEKVGLAKFNHEGSGKFTELVNFLGRKTNFTFKRQQELVKVKHDLQKAISGLKDDLKEVKQKIIIEESV